MSNCASCENLDERCIKGHKILRKAYKIRSINTVGEEIDCKDYEYISF